jgi:uncharacterized protein YdeI (YjbR/CyaY-like superfamily)
MANKDKRIDAYIAKAAPFAQPILKHFRELVHKVCPEVEETMKWSFPHYDYKGSMMCSIAAFKQHCAINFWKAPLMKNGKELVEKAKTEEAMGHLGKITSLKDLPKDAVLSKYIKEGMRLNDEGVKLSPKPKPAAQKEIATPDYFLAAIKKNKKALKVWEEFSPGKRKEYIQWITEAKTEDTRNSRMETAVEWISEGKIRNWKYLQKQK